MLAFAFTHFMDGDNVAVFERSGGGGFRPETLHILPGSQSAVQQQLDGYFAAQVFLPRPVNHPHSAAGDFFDQFVVAEVTQRCERNRQSGRGGQFFSKRDAGEAGQA